MPTNLWKNTLPLLNKIKTELFLNLKNQVGWRTKRKIVAFSVDDYGNVRVDSKQARENMDIAGLKIHSRFDAFDALENKEDLEILFDALTSVKDKNGRNAVFTPFAVPCNIDFERMETEGYQQYQYELLPKTYEKLSGLQPEAYEGVWDLWQEGIAKGLLAPQFHGREHLNLKVFEEKLEKRNFEVLTSLKNRSYTSISNSGYPAISVTAAFDFIDLKETEKFDFIIKDGLNAFEKVFNKRAIHFCPPAAKDHPLMYKSLHESGIKFIDTGLIKKHKLDKGKFKRSINYTSKKNSLGQIFFVRNVVFEPTEERGFSWVDFTLNQIEAAFRWNRPAIVSSHRVNFSGHIDPKNREKGISSLKELIKKVVKRWPDVEFLSTAELGALVSKGRKH